MPIGQERAAGKLELLPGPQRYHQILSRLSVTFDTRHICASKIHEGSYVCKDLCSKLLMMVIRSYKDKCITGWDRSGSKGSWTTEGSGRHARLPARQIAVGEKGWRVLWMEKNRWSINNLAACKQHGNSWVIKAQRAQWGPAKSSVREGSGDCLCWDWASSGTKSTFLLSYCISTCPSITGAEDRKTLLDFKSIHTVTWRSSPSRK